MCWNEQLTERPARGETLRITEDARSGDPLREHRRLAESLPAGCGRLGGSAPNQKSQSSSSVASALPITYDEPEPEKKSWFSSALGERADRIAGFTFVVVDGNIAS